MGKGRPGSIRSTSLGAKQIEVDAVVDVRSLQGRTVLSQSSPAQDTLQYLEEWPEFNGPMEVLITYMVLGNHRGAIVYWHLLPCALILNLGEVRDCDYGYQKGKHCS